MPYRSLFTFFTLYSVLIYDTYHSNPLSIVKGLHFSGLTDCCAWTPDGLNLVVSSIDGYLSKISFQEGELGTKYSHPARMITSGGGAAANGATRTFQDYHQKVLESLFHPMILAGVRLWLPPPEGEVYTSK